MDTKKAYETIRQALDADPRKRVVDSIYDEINFGNFWISFEADGQPRSVVNDRDELVLCRDLRGTVDCVTILPSLREADEQTVVRGFDL